MRGHASGCALRRLPAPRRRSAGSGNDLATELRRIDGKGYRAYKDVEGRWEMSPAQGGYALCIDWVQVGPAAGVGWIVCVGGWCSGGAWW